MIYGAQLGVLMWIFSLYLMEPFLLKSIAQKTNLYLIPAFILTTFALGLYTFNWTKELPFQNESYVKNIEICLKSHGLTLVKHKVYESNLRAWSCITVALGAWYGRFWCVNREFKKDG